MVYCINIKLGTWTRHWFSGSTKKNLFDGWGYCNKQKSVLDNNLISLPEIKHLSGDSVGGPKVETWQLVSIIAPVAKLDFIKKFKKHFHQIWHKWSSDKASQKISRAFGICKTVCLFQSIEFGNKSTGHSELMCQSVFGQLTRNWLSAHTVNALNKITWSLDANYALLRWLAPSLVRVCVCVFLIN